MAKRNGAFAVRFCLRLRVIRLVGCPCSCGLCELRCALLWRATRAPFRFAGRGRRWIARAVVVVKAGGGSSGQEGKTESRTRKGVRWRVASLFRFDLLLRVDRAPLLPALARRRFRLAGQGIALTLVRWFSEMRVVSGRGGWPNGMVQLLFVSVCACGWHGWSVVLALAGCAGCEANYSGGQPMHHSVLPEEEGVGPRGRSSSTWHAVAHRMAKRNPVPARA